jgi:hypothetical protein
MGAVLLRAIRVAGVIAGFLALLGLFPAPASAQYRPPDLGRNPVLGERYHVEVSGSIWNPALFGVISSEQFGIPGTQIDFTNDLGYKKTRFRDFRIVLRPSQKSRFRIQNTPITYTAETLLNRTLVFNGITFPVSVPIQSTFGWKVWRLGYEYDFIYKERGFAGILIEARYTDFSAELRSALGNEFTAVKGPLPAIGGVGRVYVLPDVALNFEISGFQVPRIDPNYSGSYFDWDIHGTFNVNRFVGLQVGWRRVSTLINVEKDMGDLKFQGLWFGGALRY